MNVISTIKLNLTKPSEATVVYAKQNDSLTRVIEAHLTDGVTAWEVPSNAAVLIEVAKPDGTLCLYDTLENGEAAYSANGNVVTLTLAAQALAVAGRAKVSLRIYTPDEERLTSFSFTLEIEKSVVNDQDVVSSDYYNILTQQIAAVLDAAASFGGLTVSAKKLPAGSTPTADVTGGGSSGTPYNIEFGLVEGATGPAPTIQSQTVQYQTSASGTMIPTGEWSLTPPSPVTPGTFLWAWTHVVTDSGNVDTYTVSYNGMSFANLQEVTFTVPMRTESPDGGTTPAPDYLDIDFTTPSGYSYITLSELVLNGAAVPYIVNVLDSSGVRLFPTGDLKFSNTGIPNAAIVTAHVLYGIQIDEPVTPDLSGYATKAELKPLDGRVSTLEEELGFALYPAWVAGSYTSYGYQNTTARKRTDKIPAGHYSAAINADYVLTAVEFVSDTRGVNIVKSESGGRYYFESAGEIILNTRRADNTTIADMTDAEINAIWQLKGEPITDLVAELEAEVSDLKSFFDALGEVPEIADPEETSADLYICDEHGNVIAEFADGHIRTKDFDSSAISADLVQEADKTAADLYICDSFGNVVAEFRDGQIVTKNFDSADYADVLSDLAGVISDVAALQSATSGIMYRTQSFVDGVYAACKFRTTSNHQFCLLAAGDCHSNADGPANLIKYLNEVGAVDCAVMLGDIVSNVFADSIDHYTQALLAAQKPVLTVLGNHDVRGATSDAELWSKYGALYEYADLASGEAVDGKCYYYKDFASQKMRVIVLMQYDYIYTGELCFGQDQIDWLINTLTNTPSDYAVIICEHTNPSRYMTYNMDAAYTSNTWLRSNYSPTVMNGDPVPDIIDAWIKGTSLTKTYAYTYDNPPSPLSVNVDFSSRGAGEFVTYLGGHWHQNVLGNVTDHTDQMDFHTQANSYSPTTWSGDIARKIGTVSEDSFCAVAVDRDTKTVKIFQVGAHFTDDAVNRQYFRYSYGEAGE